MARSAPGLVVGPRQRPAAQGSARFWSLPAPSLPALISGLLCLAFIGLSWWWLSEDRAIPIYDAGYHLHTALLYHQLIASGNLLGPFEEALQYPPLTFLVGDLGLFLGGLGVAPPILALNGVFVPLFVLGIHRTASLLYGRWAGPPAVAIGLSSPLLVSELHTFMVDAPEAALVSLALWLLLASRDFQRPFCSCAAGAAVGLALMVKITAPLFLAGVVIVSFFLRGGYRRLRSLGLGFAALLVVAGPWYLYHLGEFSNFVALAGAESGAVQGNLPPLLSSANWLWYFWSTMNSLLLAVPFALFVGGVVWTVRAVYRGGPLRWPRAELLAGLFVAWLAITLTPHKDIRYDLPYLPYLAVLAGGYLCCLRRRPLRYGLVAVACCAALANTLGATFGLGGEATVKLSSHPAGTEAYPELVVFHLPYAGLGVAGPTKDGNLPALLSALKRKGGVAVLTWNPRQGRAADFSSEGLIPLALIAGLRFSRNPDTTLVGPQVAELVHEPLGGGRPAPCTVLSDHTGVWVVRIDPASGRLALYCPWRTPSYYT